MTGTVAVEENVVVAGRYRISRKLGEGGMGAVYDAYNTTTEKRVAIKWMHPEIARNEQGAARFLLEAKAASRIRHRNVIDVYDIIADSSGLFLVMEYLEGESLRDLMQRRDIPVHQMLTHVIAAMRGVSAAHRQQVIHRDIKPENIFLACEEAGLPPVAKVLDFGLSKIGDQSGVRLTRTGTAMGSPQYMSLEQHSGVSDIDARTDVYAFGVIIYEIVTAQLPFDAPTYPLLVNRILTAEAVAADLLCPWVPEPLSALIQRAMAKDRNQRLTSVDELIVQLEPLVAQLAVPPKAQAATSTLDSADLAPTAVYTPIDSTIVAVPTEPSVAPTTAHAPSEPPIEWPGALPVDPPASKDVTINLLLWGAFALLVIGTYFALRPAPPVDSPETACWAGDADACISAAKDLDRKSYQYRPHFDTATLLYEQACKLKPGNNCFVLAQRYTRSYGNDPERSAQALRLYARACDHGVLQACYDGRKLKNQ